MPVRVRKFVGMLIIVAIVVLYALVATAVAVAFLGESSWYVHLAYFVLTGVLWVAPAMLVIKWMEKPAAGGPGAGGRA